MCQGITWNGGPLLLDQQTGEPDQMTNKRTAISTPSASKRPGHHRLLTVGGRRRRGRRSIATGRDRNEPVVVPRLRSVLWPSLHLLPACDQQSRPPALRSYGSRVCDVQWRCSSFVLQRYGAMCQPARAGQLWQTLTKTVFPSSVHRTLSVRDRETHQRSDQMQI